MMTIAGTAHRDEVAATRAAERALARLSVISNQARVQRESADVDRVDRAVAVFRELRFAAAAARQRHSRWYRAFIRVRGG